MSKDDPAKYQIGFDRGANSDEQWLYIRTLDGTVIHHARSWEITATHLAFARDEIGDLRRQLAEGKSPDTLVIKSTDLPNGAGRLDVAIPADWPFKKLMMACEYLLWIAASQSPAGFEKALELLCAGATTYRQAAEKGRSKK